MKGTFSRQREESPRISDVIWRLIIARLHLWCQYLQLLWHVSILQTKLRLKFSVPKCCTVASWTDSWNLGHPIPAWHIIANLTTFALLKLWLSHSWEWIQNVFILPDFLLIIEFNVKIPCGILSFVNYTSHFNWIICICMSKLVLTILQYLSIQPPNVRVVVLLLIVFLLYYSYLHLPFQIITISLNPYISTRLIPCSNKNLDEIHQLNSHLFYIDVTIRNPDFNLFHLISLLYHYLQMVCIT